MHAQKTINKGLSNVISASNKMQKTHKAEKKSHKFSSVKYSLCNYPLYIAIKF
jgi:hypothetical protein